MEGQARGVLNMMEKGKACKDVVNQISAIRSAADKAIAYIVATNLEQCILEQKELGKDTSQVAKEAVELVVKSR
ncbi:MULTISPECIES: metal-sensing transcriptional repressor [unclassified Paenibacillus]|uniref:metal-sensing transcriptional repressor n=1 Tax=unclassified Paenibacillus TaxID=185978 RepID=UPI0036459E19